MGRKVVTLQALSSKSVERVIRNACDRNWDPMCHELEALSQEQKKRGLAIREYVADIPVAEIDEIFRRVMTYNGESEAKVSPMDIWVLIHPLTKSIVFQSSSKEPIRGTQKALLESLHRCKYLEVLDINSMTV
ncbi:uncharacterized protein LOC131878650 [Tigriopus californicus]|uniref:uncharacterized protein LOC131878650 n=1 Tax=Tigriopus californicus TaxID=6832 RepID=UPI0027DA6367|nr:uncharacterized protein LOC131878650 [Tigriopus californicus]